VSAAVLGWLRRPTFTFARILNRSIDFPFKGVKTISYANGLDPSRLPSFSIGNFLKLLTTAISVPADIVGCNGK
jgi:hypothetical protein